MPSLSDYLAKNYLTADPTPSSKKSKKRKRKGRDEAEGLTIADDDATGWDRPKGKDEDDEEGMPIMIGQTSEFRKAKTSNWTFVPSASSSKDVDVAAEEEAATADAIIRSAAAENRAHAAEADDAPVIEEEDPEAETGDRDDEEVPMHTGGLQTGAEVRAAAERRRKAERRQIEAADATGRGGAMPQETIYRDASGRIINVRMKREEARRAAEAEARKKAEEEQAARGDVQREMREARRQELEDAKYMTVARSADDVDMNEELKARQRWNDPAAQFLSTRNTTTSKNKDGKKVAGKGRPQYQGAFDPNRYGIRPGFRWDGVDRGNGFEKRWFAARNRRKDIGELEYAWQMDE